MAQKLNIGIWIRLFVLSWLLGWSGCAFAQAGSAQFAFRHIQEKDGLSFNTVSCFLYDRDGFLWIGTFDGLNRYDGNNFIHFKNRRGDASSLPNNTVWDLCEDHDGNIWVATETGVSCYTKSTGRFQTWKTLQGRVLGMCSNIMCDRNGDIWFTSNLAGLFRCASAGSRMEWFPYRQPDALQTASTRIGWESLVDDPVGNGLWVADRKEGLLYFDKRQKRFCDNPYSLELSRYKGCCITALTRDGDRLIFADEAHQQLVVFDLRQRKIIKTLFLGNDVKAESVEVGHIFVDRQHNLWVSLWNNKMFFVEGGTYQIQELVHQDNNSLSVAGTFFWDGWQHPDGSVWLGTVNGISITNPNLTFYSIHDINSLFPEVSDEQGIMS